MQLPTTPEQYTAWMDAMTIAALDRLEAHARPVLHGKRLTVWNWLEARTVTADKPTCREASDATDVSHQTTSKVLKLYRAWRGIA